MMVGKHGINLPYSFSSILFAYFENFVLFN